MKEKTLVVIIKQKKLNSGVITSIEDVGNKELITVLEKHLLEGMLEKVDKRNFLSELLKK